MPQFRYLRSGFNNPQTAGRIGYVTVTNPLKLLLSHGREQLAHELEISSVCVIRVEFFYHTNAGVPVTLAVTCHWLYGHCSWDGSVHADGVTVCLNKPVTHGMRCERE